MAADSSDLNLVDFHVWSVLELQVWSARICDINHLQRTSS